jgi:hypothetical protein
MSKSDENNLDNFQEQVSSMYGKLAAIFQRADSLLSEDKRDAIIVANCSDPAPSHDGRPFSTWYEATLESTRWFLWIPVSAAGPLNNLFDNGLADGSWITNLGAILADVDGPGRMDYWRRIVDKIKSYREIDPEEADARIRREFGNAIYLTSDDSQISWSAPATMQTWSARFNRTARTLQKWRKDNTLHMKSTGRKNSWVVDESDPLYVEWSEKRKSLAD